jgi:hypothetical protein
VRERCRLAVQRNKICIGVSYSKLQIVIFYYPVFNLSNLRDNNITSISVAKLTMPLQIYLHNLIVYQNHKLANYSQQESKLPLSRSKDAGKELWQTKPK